MKAIVKTKPEDGFQIVSDHPERPVGSGQVRVEVAAASPCGTDRELVRYGPAAEAFGMELPVVLGHEASGVVVEIGPNVTMLRTGDRVALESHIACRECYQCRTGAGHNCLNMLLLGLHIDGGFAESLVVPENACYPLPDNVPIETGALFESAGVAVHASLRSRTDFSGRSVLVAGAGPIGLALVQLANISGARRVAVIEPNPFRRQVAESFGAVALESNDGAVDWCRDDAADRGGFDVGFDCTGAAGALDIVLRSLRREATAVCVGVPRAPFPLDITRFVIKQGLTVTGSFGRSLWQTWDVLTSLVSSGRFDLDALVTHRMGLSEFQKALDLQGGDAGKVLLIPALG
jgi:threonine 3-dehydrogenase